MTPTYCPFDQLRAINEAFRRTLIGGHIHLAGDRFITMDRAFIQTMVRKLRSFNGFTEGGDPRRVHESGSFKVKGERIMFQIVYQAALVPDQKGRAEMTVVPVLTLSFASIKS